MGEGEYAFEGGICGPWDKYMHRIEQVKPRAGTYMGIQSPGQVRHGTENMSLICILYSKLNKYETNLADA